MVGTENQFGLALLALRICSPSLIFLCAIALLQSRASAPEPSEFVQVIVEKRTSRRSLLLTLISLISLTFFVDGAAFVVFAVINKVWPQNTGIEYNTIGGLLAYSGLALVGAWKAYRDVDVFLYSWIRWVIFTAILIDTAYVILEIISFDFANFAMESMFHLVAPACRVLLLVVTFFTLCFPRITYGRVSVETHETTESSNLLSSTGVPDSSTGLSPVSALTQNESSRYGTFQPKLNISNLSHGTRTPSPIASGSVTPIVKPEEKPEISLTPGWREISRRLLRIVPYLFPSNSIALQSLILLCFIILIIGRAVNVFLPLSLREVISILEDPDGRSIWPFLFAYVCLRFLSSSGGLSALRDILWTPVMQYSDREMSQLSFDHLLNLSFGWHMKRKTGEVLRILDRGSVINRSLELVLFSIVPTFADIAIALVMFRVVFEWTLTLVVLAVMGAYVIASVLMTQWRTKIRREMNERDVITRGIHTDTLLNFETVKYFGGESREGGRYRDAVREYQVLEYRMLISLNLLNLTQNLIITLGLLAGSMIVANRVTRGESNPSDFIYFITYLAQLYGPLNQLGYLYRSINQSLVDTEKLLKLLAEPTDINDKPGAPDLIVRDGIVEFDNVNFSYDDRAPALKGVSFRVPKNSSVALVGESGAGKSTVLRLLYRFYDLREGQGRILIDGQDIRDITQASLRRAIGVVPQDSVLFNTSIGYNIGYGKFDATQEEIEIAAQSAQMHDKIMKFPNGYDTKVGERGVRLSGGEKQRVAIARTLLKNPPILLLDEATSALDTSTEKDIQRALLNLQKGRSSLSIAHRLSTIANAHVILVLKDGQIVEQGSKAELLALDGVFAAMWKNQVEAGVIEVPTPSMTKHEEENASIKDELHTTHDILLAKEQPTAEKTTEATTDDDATAQNAEESVELSEATSNPAIERPFIFPTRSNQESLNLPTPPATVKFGISENPERVGTTDPSMEGRRKRTLSQTVGKFARRISTGPRRPSQELQREGSTSSGTVIESNSSADPTSKGRKLKKERKGVF